MERFQRSGSTISKHFGDILKVVGRLVVDLIRPRDPSFGTIPLHILNNRRYYPFFKDCVGALDGCHIELTVPTKDRTRFINRKGVATTNVLAVCDFDLLFMYVCAGWEGSAHDTRVYMDSISDRSLRFPTPLGVKYYLGDKGYPDRKGLLTPHMRVSYHRTDFRGGQPTGPREKFNIAHSSLRSVIERSFGVLKARWHILQKIPSYKLEKQIEIINACFTLHNFIRLSTYYDPCFELLDALPNFIPNQDIDDETDD